SLNRPKLGVEYLHGEKNLFSTNEFNQIEDETGFYATMGDAYHAYYSQDINENLSFQLGFRLQKQQYDIPQITLMGQTVNSNLGSAEKDRETIETVYLRGL